MIIDRYNEIFKQYKEFIEENSIYNTRVVKNYTSKSPSFPIITCQLSNFTDTDYCTIDKIENHREMYLTIDIFTKDKNVENQVVSSQKINDELTNLTIKFFEAKNIKITLCRIIPNLDADILRRMVQCQGLVSLSRNNIIRR